MSPIAKQTSPGCILLMSARPGDECAGFVKRLEQGGYSVASAVSAERAGDLLQNAAAGEHRFDAVVACTAADNNDAIVLLERVGQLYPGPVRVLVGEAGDSHAIAPMLNAGVVERLLLRPCSAEALFGVVDAAVRQRRELQEHSGCTRRIERLERKLRTLVTDIDAGPGATGTDPVNYYDELTAVASRALLEDRLAHAIQTGRRHSKKVVLILLGLDRFRYVNESYGRQVGDRVLTEVARRISGCVRSSDTVGRYGGDMFGLVVVGGERAEDPGVMAQRVLEAVAVPMDVADHHIVLTASIGIGLYPDDGMQPRDLVACAETAMRHAKLQHGNQFRFYSAEFNRLAGRRLSLESELHRAIENHEFTLYYQPRIDTGLNCVVGAEALLRWVHPTRGVLAPAEFLPVLEETGLIEPVGQWVLEQAAHTLTRWRRTLPARLMLAVNLSARQFRRKRLPELIAGIADAASLDLTERNLELEITESLLMEDIESTRRTLHRLHDMGLRIAIDDFGTGYSALSYLIKFSLDYLKVDKSFVDRLEESEDAKAIVEAIISLSYSLHLTVIAEGVETREQLTSLQALGCKQFQGYLFAKPMPEHEFVELVARDGGASIATLVPEDRLLRDPIPERRRKSMNH